MLTFVRLGATGVGVGVGVGVGAGAGADGAAGWLGAGCAGAGAGVCGSGPANAVADQSTARSMGERIHDQSAALVPVDVVRATPVQRRTVVRGRHILVRAIYR
jgi:hypothetical protein